MEKVWLKSYEPHVPPSIAYPPVPLYQFMDDAAKKYPNNTAIIYGGVVHQLGGALLDAKMTFQQLHDLTNRFAAALQGLGVKKGDRVALFLPNCPQFPIAYYATLKAGGIVVPCNPLYVARELEHQVNDAGAETIVVLSRFYPIVKQIRAHTKLKNVIVTNVKEYFPGLLKTLFTLAVEKKEGHRVDITGEANTYWFQDLLAKGPATPQPVDVQPQDTAVLLYTGGTTGVPKGAELSHRNIVANAVQCKTWLNAREGQEMGLTSIPLFHSYGMTTCMNLCMCIGGAMLLIPNPRDIEHILKAITKHHPTMFPGVPTMYVAINNYPDISKYDLKSIRACVSGAAGLPLDVQKKFEQLTGGKLVEGYGLSETSPVTHANPLFGQNKVGTIGVPWPDTEAKIMDLETGTKEMPLGEIGELVIRGPQVMKGYWNMPEETKNTLRDGWLYTGDIARMDQDGYFQIVDRKKDMIIAGGFNIYPRDVEEVLYKHPKVKEAVVAGVPDLYRGETVKAYIVLKEGQTATVEEIVDFCRQNLAKFKVPTAVEFRDSLPKTMVGKILRRMLVEEEKKKLAEKK
ncbi:MAG: long-chain fatty acid--CoA ligase [Chloroflexi bacterium]|nr:long-chain fatty acid--CoA ligase [Chloroflexota bacterium]